MGKRGPKGASMEMLCWWESLWNQQLRFLRDGRAIPRNLITRSALLNIKLAKQKLDWLKRAPADEILPETLTKEEWRQKKLAEEERQIAIGEITKQIEEFQKLQMPVPGKEERQQIWNALWKARTFTALRKACERWKELKDIKANKLECWPEHVLANAKQFLRMTRAKNTKGQRTTFPRSNYIPADDSRIEFIARGMAGIFVGISPATAIERLRNMSHAKDGPLWNAAKQACDCWRCQSERENTLSVAIERKL
jgi:hypothetical protein